MPAPRKSKLSLSLTKIKSLSQAGTKVVVGGTGGTLPESTNCNPGGGAGGGGGE